MSLGSLASVSVAMLLFFAIMAMSIVAIDPVAASGKEPVIELYMHGTFRNEVMDDDKNVQEETLDSVMA
ncbi:hypothetical protein VNO77_14269 [Canavalia gladiata]|uniref:Uncharacterized protein n=1 Tax=Canavalia gladiata TaxID=3824 RepID=A0AAN9M3D1_CANGL